MIFYSFKNRTQILIEIKQSKKLLLQKFTKFNFFERIILFFVLFFGLFILFQGLVFPPNNWDSLTYHMSRIIFWLSNETVDHYQTNILRELYQPPFSEFFILHINLLNGNDLLSNFVQLLYLFSTFLVTWLFLNLFFVKRVNKLIAVLLLISIPSIALQASTTKNDIVCGFFVISTLYYAFTTYRNLNLNNFLYLGISIGLAFFTKGTAYLFIAPIILLFSILYLIKIYQNKDYKPFLYGFVSISIILLINAGHYKRNFDLSSNILNIDITESKMYSNEEINLDNLISNSIKNIGLHLGYPFFDHADELIKKIHETLDIDIDNPQTNYGGMKYQVSQDLVTHEDGVCNTVHIILFFSAIVIFFSVLFFNIMRYKVILGLLFVLIIQFILFAGYLKWQPWHTRLHIPMFMLMAIIMALCADKIKFYKYLVYSILPILSVSLMFFLVFNNVRPIIQNTKFTKPISITDNRYYKYFANQPYLYDDYACTVDLLFVDNPEKIGLMLSDWEYPLLKHYYYDKINVYSLNVGNITNKIQQDTSNIDVIIANNNQTFIEFNNRKYFNKTPNNQYIWYYK